MTVKFSKNQIGLSKVIIAVIAIVVIAIVGVGAYALMSQNAAPSSSPSPTNTATTSVNPTSTVSSGATSTPAATQTPATTPTSTPTTAPSSVSVNGASSLKYSVSHTENGVVTGTYTYYGKNAGTTNFMMRIEYTDSDGNTIYILNGAQQKAWTYSDNNWEDNSAAYSMMYSTWSTSWQGYMNALGAWSGMGDYSYTAGADTVRIYDIQVNPNLADSLFEHT